MRGDRDKYYSQQSLIAFLVYISNQCIDSCTIVTCGRILGVVWVDQAVKLLCTPVLKSLDSTFPATSSRKQRRIQRRPNCLNSALMLRYHTHYYSIYMNNIIVLCIIITNILWNIVTVILNGCNIVKDLALHIPLEQTLNRL